MTSAKRAAWQDRQRKVEQRDHYRIGMTANHPKFGLGRIISKDETSVTFDFGEFGERRILRSILQPILPNGAANGAANGWSDSIRHTVDDIIERLKPRNIEPTPYCWKDGASILPRPWMYGHVLLRGCVSLLIAPGGVGKSSLAIVEALAMASGRKLLHDQPYGRSRVWLWNGEEDRVELDRRCAAACQHHGVTEEELGDMLYVDSGLDEGKEIVIACMNRDSVIIAKPMKDALISAIREKCIDVLIIDPFVSCHEVPENNNSAIDKVAKTYMKIAKETGCAILLIHHTRKTDGRVVDIEDARGASALRDAVRAARALNVMTDEDAANAGVENRFRYVRVADGKENYALRADKARWLRLASVVLSNGDDVGVPEPWEWPDAFAGVTAADLLTAQRAVEGGHWREHHSAKDWVGNPIAQALGRDLRKPAERKAIRTMVGRWIANGAFKVVEGLDDVRIKRSYVEVGEWAT